MFRYAIFALVGLLSAVTTAKAVVTLDEARRAQPRYERPMAAVARIARADDGHYWAIVEVGGEAVRFLVDTGATVHNVEALVIEKGLETSLLGMSYLGRLSRFEATPAALVLRP